MSNFDRKLIAISLMAVGVGLLTLQWQIDILEKEEDRRWGIQKDINSAHSSACKMSISFMKDLSEMTE